MVLSARAKRLLDQSGPGLPRRKRAKTVVIRPKSEMKFSDTGINHVTVSASTQRICHIAVGANSFNRIGNKVKLHAIEYNVNSQDANSFRMDILRLKDSAEDPGHNYNLLPSATKTDRLLTQYFASGTLMNSLGAYGVYKLPLGNVLHFAGPASDTNNRNEIVVYFTSKANSTISGNIRIWYTDN